MNRLKTISLSIFVLISLLLLSGCGYRAVPSQYDLKLKTKVSELSCENGGNLAKLEITIYFWHIICWTQLGRYLYRMESVLLSSLSKPAELKMKSGKY